MTNISAEKSRFAPSPFIEDSHKLVDLIGEWPSFEDAELIELRLERADGAPWKPGSTAPTLTIKVRLAETGYCLAEIRFHNARYSEFANFSYQNSIQEIVFEQVPERVDERGSCKPAGYSAEIIAHCGLRGRFEFQSGIVLSVAPCDRDGQI